MDVDPYIDWLMNLEPDLAIAGLAALAALLLVAFNRRRLAGGWREWRIRRLLDHIGHEQIRNLRCPDGLDGYHEIERLALASDSILVIAYKRFSGNIYCAEQIDEWTQMIGQKSFKFANPLYELEYQLTSLRLQTGCERIEGFIFFDASAAFPKGHPENVWHPGNIPPSLMREHCPPPSAEIGLAWDHLKALHQTGSKGAEIGVKA